LIQVPASALFVSLASGAEDLHLRSGAPAIDAGAPSGALTDIDGELRPRGAGWDIGADER
jgi:hypothetical protein